VSYPGNHEELESELEYLRSIIAGSDRSDQIAEAGGFLFIAGWRDVDKNTIEWWGYVYDRAHWRRLLPSSVRPNTVLESTATGI